MLRAVEVGYQWRWERFNDKTTPSEMRTDSIMAMIPDDTQQDISFIFTVGYKAGWEIVEYLGFTSSQHLDEGT
jgi:hypothetical protein